MTSTYQPSLTLALAIKKAHMLADIRAFFAQKNVLEVTTPILSKSGNTDVFIQSVSANFTQKGSIQRGYLHTSPEFAMKRLLASYQVPIYQICQVFRDNEQGGRHNIEFSMLEWYRPQFSLEALITELGQLLETVLGQRIIFKHYRYSQTFVDRLGIHPFIADIQTLQNCAHAHQLTVDMGQDKQGWLDLLFSHLIEPNLGKDSPTLVIDYPPATAALAKIQPDVDGFLVAKRFELYLNGIEIANAYDELTDGQALLKRFNEDNQQRMALGLPAMPIDQHLIEACGDLPSCSGIALGLDRLFMVRENLSSIDKAISITTQNS